MIGCPLDQLVGTFPTLLSRASGGRLLVSARRVRDRVLSSFRGRGADAELTARQPSQTPHLACACNGCDRLAGHLLLARIFQDIPICIHPDGCSITRVPVCIHIRIRTCPHSYTHTHTNMHMHTCTHTNMPQPYAYAYMHICICPYAYPYAITWVWVSVWVWVSGVALHDSLFHLDRPDMIHPQFIYKHLNGSHTHTHSPPQGQLQG